jgi:hypothetical protein
VALVAVTDLVHLLDAIEVAHDAGRAEGVAGLHRLVVDLLNHGDDPPGTLAAPRLVDDRGVEPQAGQPGAVLARLPVPQVVGADEMARRPMRVAPVDEFQVGAGAGRRIRWTGSEPLGSAQVAEVGRAERVALAVGGLFPVPEGLGLDPRPAAVTLTLQELEERPLLPPPPVQPGAGQDAGWSAASLG